jgi:hypothetical protein
MGASFGSAAFSAGPPLYTGNDSPVITPYVVVVACRAHDRHLPQPTSVSRTGQDWGADSSLGLLPLTPSPTVTHRDSERKFPLAAHRKISRMAAREIGSAR